MGAQAMPEPIIFAIPKGRILDEALPLLARVGIEPSDEFFDKKSRALVFGTNQPHIRSEESRVGKEWVSSVDIGGRRIIKIKCNTNTSTKKKKNEKYN